MYFVYKESHPLIIILVVPFLCFLVNNHSTTRYQYMLARTHGERELTARGEEEEDEERLRPLETVGTMPITPLRLLIRRLRQVLRVPDDTLLEA